MELQSAEADKLTVGDLFSATTIQEQEDQKRYDGIDVDDASRDLASQAADFLRGSRATEPFSNLKPSDADQKRLSDSKVDKSENDGDYGDLGGGKQESPAHRLPHEEVPQPGQYTEMDTVMEVVALDSVMP